MLKTSEKPSILKASRKRVFGQGEKTPRAGLYARVSTHDQQTLPMQLSAMRDYARKRGWQIAFEMKDIGSGATLREKREELMVAARKRDIDLVVVWRLDRWGRSLVDLVNTLQESAATVPWSCD
jgi:putative DNA-invertase from lambdoid prophage Rac